MKLKRFLAIIALLILTMIMLTGCMDEEIETDANVLLKFDNQQISISPDKGNYVYLEINVKDGDYEDTFVKRFAVSGNQTLTVGLEDIAKDFFSENAQICNAKVVKTTKEEVDWVVVIFLTAIIIPVVLIILWECKIY